MTGQCMECVKFLIPWHSGSQTIKGCMDDNKLYMPQVCYDTYMLDDDFFKVMDLGYQQKLGLGCFQ